MRQNGHTLTRRRAEVPHRTASAPADSERNGSVSAMFRDRTAQWITRCAWSARRRKAAVLDASDPIIAQSRCLLASTLEHRPHGNAARAPGDDRLCLVNRLLFRRAAGAEKTGTVRNGDKAIAAYETIGERRASATSTNTGMGASALEVDGALSTTLRAPDRGRLGSVMCRAARPGMECGDLKSA